MKKNKMVIKITSEQFLKILESQPLHLPVCINLKGLSKIERDRLFDKIKSKSKLR